jgi:hypothetical protein
LYHVRSTAFQQLKAALILCFCVRLFFAQQAPRTWDAQALSEWATPLAATGIRPGHFSENEYYRAPVDNYRTYPVYHPDREPAGYWDKLKRQKPEPLIDVEKAGPGFNWVAAGKRVWQEADVPFFRLFDAESISLARSAEYVRKNEKRMVVRPDGTLAHYRWVITPRGIGLSITACSSCHTRFLDDGTAWLAPALWVTESRTPCSTAWATSYYASHIRVTLSRCRSTASSAPPGSGTMSTKS